MGVFHLSVSSDLYVRLVITSVLELFASYSDNLLQAMNSIVFGPLYIKLHKSSRTYLACSLKTT